MKSLLNKCLVIISIIILAGFFVSCGHEEEENKAISIGNIDISPKAIEITGASEYPQTPVKTDYPESDNTYINLDDEGCEITGSGAAVQSNIVTISAPGTYVISGSLSEGQIIVAEHSGSEAVIIVLNGISLKNSVTAPIYIADSLKTIIDLPADSVNILEYNGSDNPGAAGINSDVPLRIKGSGKLYLTNTAGTSILCQKDLKIKEASLNLKTAEKGIEGQESVTIYSGSINIDSDKYGIIAGDSEKEPPGYIAVNGGHLEIRSLLSSMTSIGDITINGGEIYLLSGGGSDAIAEQEMKAAKNCQGKGLHARGNISLEDTIIQGDCAGTAIGAGGKISINNSDLTLSSACTGVYGREKLEIAASRLSISQSYTALKSRIVTLNSGALYLSAQNDGISVNSSYSQDAEKNNETGLLNIAECTLIIDTGGNGLSINGSAKMNGGEVLIYSYGSEEGGLQYSNDFLMEEGRLIVFSYEDTMGISSQSSQNSLFVGLNGKADSTLEVRDNNGKTIVWETCPKDFHSVMISLPELSPGLAYNFYLNEENIGAFEPVP